MFVIGTAGHVDHGKSSLIEALTGTHPDRLAEEKRRGLTIDLGFARLLLPSGREAGVVDVPGHERFIRNMLAGAGGATACLFVVAANEGWMPQSSEHLSAIHLLGIDVGVIALTKADTVEPDDLEVLEDEVRNRVANTGLEDAEIVPCSAVTRFGLSALLEALDRALDRIEPSGDGRPRLWVDRSFSMSGAGTVVTGTLTGGALTVGDEARVHAGGTTKHVRVRGLQTHNRDVDSIGPDNRAAINLTGIDRSQVERGDCVVRPGEWRPTDRFNALIRVLGPSLTGVTYDLTSKGSHLLYVGTAETAVRIRLLDADRATTGDEVPAQLVTARPLPLSRGDRFVLRDAGPAVTFGGGIVVDPLPRATKAKDADVAALTRRLWATQGTDALGVLLDHEGDLPLEEVRLRIGLRDLPDGVSHLGGRVFSSVRVDRLSAHSRELLRSHHLDFPLERGMAKSMLAKLLELDAAVTDDLLAHDPEVVVEGSLVRLRTHVVSITPAQIEERDSLVAQLDAARFAPPPSKTFEVDPSLLRALEDSGELVRIADFHLTAALVDELESIVTTAIAERGPRTVAEIRDLLGTTRRFALPLCEWMDGVGITRRNGDLRSLGPRS